MSFLTLALKTKMFKKENLQADSFFHWGSVWWKIVDVFSSSLGGISWANPAILIHTALLDFLFSFWEMGYSSIKTVFKFFKQISEFQLEGLHYQISFRF